MTEHIEYVCHGNHDGRSCMFCDGGLFCCAVCNSFEGATTTDCPGERMTLEQSDAVYAGTLDYRDGAWVDAPSSHTPNGRALLAAHAAEQPAPRGDKHKEQ